MSLWNLDPTLVPRPLRSLAQKEIHLWIAGWSAQRLRALRARPTGKRHLLFAICDHYEPLHGDVTKEQGLDRVLRWRQRYPEIASSVRDSNGRPPRHSYFFPGEQYDPRFIEPLAELCNMGLGEVEVHLHHDGDTRDTLTAVLEKALEDLGRHGVIATLNGRPAWAFIHGDWALANARRDRRHCGVDDELLVLHELGCYADFTFPCAPDQSQPGIVNSIYYPSGDLSRRRCYEQAERVHVGTSPKDRVLLIEGPLALSFRPGRLAVRIEAATLDHTDPPTAPRLRTWVKQAVCVEGRPEWVFVKVHTHGAPERNADVMLGDAIVRFHEALASYNDGTQWDLHYVTAREMFNVARAAMDGKKGSPASYFDYVVPPPARAT